MFNKRETDHTKKIVYKNYRGETANRTIVPIKTYWGKTEYHPQEQWLLKAFDVDKNAVRDFAIDDMIGDW